MNLLPKDPDWLHWQLYYLVEPELYPVNDYCPFLLLRQYYNVDSDSTVTIRNTCCFQGIFHRISEQDDKFTITAASIYKGHTWLVVAVRDRPWVNAHR